MAGDIIDERLRTRLRECEDLVVLLSPCSKSREWVLIEIGAAWGLKKRIVIILLYVETAEIPKVVAPYEAIHLNDFKKHVAQIARRG